MKKLILALAVILVFPAGALAFDSAYSGAQVDAAVAKIQGVEASADVTDATNVAAAGAVMDSGANTLTGDYDAGATTFEVPNSTTLPATCTVGDMYMDTDATSGQRFFLCESTNNWVLQSGVSEMVDDTSPQLGGNLDMNGNTIHGVDETEMSYLSTVTSNVQTQLDGKSPTTGHASIATVGTISTGTWQGTAIGGAYIDIANTTAETNIAADDLIIIYDLSATANRAMTRGNFVTGIGAGQAIVFDIDDNGTNQSTDLGEIAIVNDTNDIVTLDAADKMKIDMGQNWPTSDLAVTLTITDNEATAETNALIFTAGGALTGGNLGLESDGDLTYTPSTGTLAATEFSGGGAGLTSVDAATGDSATGFFDAGTIEHEYGGLEADISAYSGLIGVNAGATSEVDTLAEVNALITETLGNVAGTADVSGDWENQDNIARSFGNDNDFEVAFDTDLSDNDGGDNDFAAGTWTTESGLTISGSSTSDLVVLLNNSGTGGVDLYVEDIHYSGSINSTGTGDSYLAMSNNSGGLAPSGYRIYFETDGSDVLSYSINGSEKRFANLEDAQTISGIKTFSTDIVLTESADHASTPGAGFGYLWVRSDTPSSLIYTDDSGTDVDLTASALGDIEAVGPAYASGAAFTDGVVSTGTTMLVWEGTTDNTNEFSLLAPSADPGSDINITFPGTTGTLALLAGSDTQVIYNSGGTAYAGDAGFVFNATTDALTLGEDGQDGTLVLYNESGGTDYTATIATATQSGDATITLPGATGTLATLGNAETFSGAKGFSSAPFSSVANTTALGTTSGEWADLYLGDGAIIYGQNDQSNTITSSAAGWSFALDVDVLGNIELGHATANTLSASGGTLSIEGNAVYHATGTDVPVTDGGTGASTLTDGGVLLGSGTGAVTALAVLSDGEMIVGDGTTDPVAESGATLRTSIGVGTGDSPQFTGIELGHASDTTVARTAAGEVTIEGSPVAQRDHEVCTPPIVMAEPDELQPIADAWQLMYFPAEQYPYGVTITALHISTSATCTDALNFEEWSNNGTAWSTDATVEAITLSGTFTEDDGTLSDSAIAADAYLYVDLPATPTDIASYEITVCYTRDNS